MAGFNYDRAVKTATRLITKFGQQGQLQRKSNNFADEPLTIVVLNYEQRLIDGTRIKASDRMIYVAVNGVELTTDDRVKDAAGVVYAIVPPLKPLNPAGKVVYWEIQGRV